MSIHDNLYRPEYLAVEIVTRVADDLGDTLDAATRGSLEIVLEARLAEYNAKYCSLHDRYATSEDRIEELTASYEAKIDDYKRCLAEERGRKKSDMDVAVASAAESHSTFATDADIELLELEMKIADLEESLDGVTSELNTEKASTDRLKREKIGLARQNEMMHERNKALLKQNDELERKIDDLQEESENWRTEIEKALTKKDADNKAQDQRLRKDSQEHEQRYNELSAELASARDMISQQRGMIRGLEIELRDTIEDRNRPNHTASTARGMSFDSLRTGPLRTSSFRMSPLHTGPLHTGPPRMDSLPTGPLPTGPLATIPETQSTRPNTASLLGELDLLNSKPTHQESYGSLGPDYMTSHVHEMILEGKEHEITVLKQEKNDLLMQIKELENEATEKNVGTAAAGDSRVKTQARQLRAAQDKIARLERTENFQERKISRQSTRLDELKAVANVTTGYLMARGTAGAGVAGASSGKLAELLSDLANVEGKLEVHKTLLGEAKHERLALQQQRIQDALFHELKGMKYFHYHFLDAIEAALGTHSSANNLRDILARQAVDFIKHRHAVFEAVQRLIPRTGKTHRKYREMARTPRSAKKSPRDLTPSKIEPIGDPEILKDIENNLKDLYDRFDMRLRSIQHEIRALGARSREDTDNHTRSEFMKSLWGHTAPLEKKRRELKELVALGGALDKLIRSPTTNRHESFSAVGDFLEPYTDVTSTLLATLSALQLKLVLLLMMKGEEKEEEEEGETREAREQQQLYHQERSAVLVVMDQEADVWDEVRMELEQAVDEIPPRARIDVRWLLGADRVRAICADMAERARRERDRLLRNVARFPSVLNPRDKPTTQAQTKTQTQTWTWDASNRSDAGRHEGRRRGNVAAGGNTQQQERLRDMLAIDFADFARDTCALFLAALKHFLVWVPLAGAFGAMVIATVAEARLYADWKDANAAYTRALWVSMLKRPTFCFGPLDTDYIWYAVREALLERWGYRYYR